MHEPPRGNPGAVFLYPIKQASSALSASRPKIPFLFRHTHGFPEKPHRKKAARLSNRCLTASRPARDILFSLSGPPANISTSLSGGQKRSKTRYFHFIDQNAGVAYRFANYRDLKESKVQVFFDIQSKKARDISDISEFNGNFAPRRPAGSIIY